ncbi:MAG: hypothetical protein KAI43_12815 [Candidatus Aureabacteria bacterium]|nr:hypothetical protein [Candidatus Auribacterota bacterium]
MEEQEKTLEEQQDGTPLCIHCLKPYSPNENFCKNCGEAVGTYTAFMPFERIFVFTNSIKNCWHKLFYEKGVSFGLKVLMIIYLMLTAPFIIILGLPFVLFYKLRKKKFDNK